MRVVIERLSKTYTDRRGRAVEALAEVSLSVAAQEFVALLGPSGCGKSTLLQVVAGLTAATAGRVFFEDAPPGRPLTAMVFQEFALFPWRTVQGNVEFGLEELGVPRPERTRRARALIEMLGLRGFETRYPHQLSGGMRQRVGIARALAVDPAVLLMDEPFSALDAQTRRLLEEELLALWERRPTTILYVTHNIEEAVFLADRVVVLSRRPGRVLDEIPVPLGRPRTEAMLGAPALLETSGRIWALIKDQARAALVQ
jgi:NitT/TauT family transport system ATP-binding protein